MENILISIIVPAYNIEAFIGRCLDSILNQTHKNIEVIVINDGSTDKTGEIINAYASKDNRIIPIHKENGGVSSSRLAGIKKSHGMYIGFIDGDDWIETTMYQSLLRNALVYNADISHCGYKMIFPDGHEDLYYGTKEKIEQNHNDGLRDLLIGKKIEPSLCNKLYHRSVVEGFNTSELWDENIRNNEDLLMNYIFFKKARSSVYEDIPFYHYILRKGSAATSNDKHYKITDPLKVMNIIKEDVKENLELYPIIYERYLRTLIGTAMQGTWEKDSSNAKKVLKEECKKVHFFNNCKSSKLRLMVFAVAYLQGLYRVVRKIYERITGVAKKFDI